VADTRTVKARGFKTGWTASDSGFASYWIPAGTVAAPAINPATGTYPALTLATIATATTGATIRFTLDGSDPDAASPVYALPIVLTTSTTLKARAFLAGYTASPVTTATFAVGPGGQSMAPTISPRGGWFDTEQSVTVSATAGATVRYTLTGSDPTTSDPVVPPTGLTIDRLLSSISKRRLGSVSECNAARTRFLSEVRKSFQDGRNDSNKKRDK